MMSFGPKKIVAILLTLLGILMLLIAGKGFYKAPEAAPVVEKVENQVVKDLGQVKILSTTPANLNGRTLLPTDSIEIVFDNSTVAFDPNYHVVIEPKVEVETKISDDLTTITIKPKKSWAVGTTYNLMLKSNLKFSGDKTLGQDVNFSFNTLAIKGI